LLPGLSKASKVPNRGLKHHSSIHLGKLITNKVCLLTLLPVLANALLWSCAPLAGWGRYGVEPFGLSCSLEWHAIPWSYTVGIFACCYGLPLLLMLFCYGSIVVSVRRASRRIKLLTTSLDSYVTKVMSHQAHQGNVTPISPR
jgi:hypothetical protein